MTFLKYCFLHTVPTLEGGSSDPPSENFVVHSVFGLLDMCKAQS